MDIKSFVVELYIIFLGITLTKEILQKNWGLIAF